MLTGVAPFFVGAAAVLLNSLWQDALIVLAVVLILRLLPNANASTRYAMWWSALVAALLVPIVTTVPFLYANAPMTASNVSTTTAGSQMPAAGSYSTRTAGHPTAAGARTQWSGSTIRTSTQSVAPHRPRVTLPVLLAESIAALWAVLALAILIRLGVALTQLEALKRDALPLPVDFRDDMSRWTNAVKGGRDVRLCISEETEVPVAVGLFDAMILIPRHLLETLGHNELDQISLHELAHLRRADDWTNGLQRVISALLFFNPAIRYIGQQLDVEREVACDDWVVNQTGAVRPYAMCLTKMAETTAWPHRAVPAPGVFVTRKNISIRIERLLRAGRDIGTGISPAPAAVAAACIIALGLLAWTVSPSFAFDLTAPAAVLSVTPPHGVNALPSALAEPTIPKQSEQTTLTIKSQSVQQHAKTMQAVIINKVQSMQQHAEAMKTAIGALVPALTPEARAKILENPAVVKIKTAGTPDERQVQEQVKRAVAQAAPPAPPEPGVLPGSSSGPEVPGCSGCNFENADYSGKDLRGRRFTGSNFAGANFSNANLSNASLTGSNLERANFRNANLRNADLTGTNMENADLTGADVTGAKLAGIHLENVKFGPQQARAILEGCKGCEIGALDLHGVDLSNLQLTGLMFTGTNLRGASFANSRLTGIEFQGCDLTGAIVRGAHISGVEFPGTKLDGIDWSQAYLTGVQLNNR